MKIYIGVVQNSDCDRCHIHAGTNKKEVIEYLFKNYRKKLEEEQDADKTIKFTKKEFIEALQDVSAYIQCPSYHINFELHTLDI